MLIARSENRKAKTASAAVADAVGSVSPLALREFVELLSFPRPVIATIIEAMTRRGMRSSVLRLCSQEFRNRDMSGLHCIGPFNDGT